jgi:hypothetical protein
MPTIVSVVVSQQVAPTPSTLQKTGAIISVGGTNTAAGTVSLVTQPSDVTALYNGARTLTTLTWLSGTVTATAAAAHGITVGQTLLITIGGATPSGYNGTYTATATTTTAFTYPVASNPGTITVLGMFTLEDVAELSGAITTFFGQGANQSVYILELGELGDVAAIAALSSSLIANPLRFYSYLVPRSWANQATFLALVQAYESPSAKQYFFVTMTLANYTSFTTLMKNVIGLVEAPGVIPVSEMSLAAAFYVSLNYAPGATNKVTPYAFSYLYGVTPYPTFGNNVILTQLKAAGVNYVGTGAEGGISNAILLWGTTMDLRDFTYWYSADWVQINVALNIANAVINGSNNPVNPLYYDQNGINALQGVIAQVMSNGVAFGLVLGTPVELAFDGPVLNAALGVGTYSNQTIVNAIPFIPYSSENPGDYKIGRYAGFSTIYTPKRGFLSIVFNLVVSDFVSV